MNKTRSRSRIIPHGQVAFADIRDSSVRDRIMRLGENDMALAEEVAALKEEVAQIKQKVR